MSLDKTDESVTYVDTYSKPQSDILNTTPLNGDIRYTVKYGDEWQPDMINLISSDDSNRDYAGSFTKPITYLTIGGVEKYRVYSAKHGWSKYHTKYDKNDPAGDGSPILALEVWDKHAKMAVHIKGGTWSHSEIGTFDGDTRDPKYIGNMMMIDAFWIYRI